MKRWQDFLDSLSTKGGNILVLFCGLGVLIGLMIHLTHDQTTDAAMVSAAHDMMVGFGAALLGALSGSSSRQQMADRVQTAMLPSTTPQPTTPEPPPAPGNGG